MKNTTKTIIITTLIALATAASLNTAHGDLIVGYDFDTGDADRWRFLRS